MSAISKTSDSSNAVLLVDQPGSKRHRTGSTGGHTYVAIPTPDQPFPFTALPDDMKLAVLRKLNLPDIANIRLVSKSMKEIATHNHVWFLNAKAIDCPLNTLSPYFSQVESFIKELRKTVISFKLINLGAKFLQIKIPIIAGINNLQTHWKHVKAYDALRVWKKMAAFADLPLPDVSHIKSIDALIAKAEEFPAWCEKNRDVLGSAPFDEDGDPMLDDGDPIHDNDVFELDLSNLKLRTLPKEICYLTRLTGLKLENNVLSELPSSISKLTRLIALDLDNNRISTLPSWIFDFPDLSYFSFAGNALTELPEQILKLFQKNQGDPDHSIANFSLWFSLAQRLNCPLKDNEYDTLSSQIDIFLLNIMDCCLESDPVDIRNRLESFTIEDINYLQNWFKARDTLVLWEALAKALFSSTFAPLSHSKEYFAKAEEFPQWCAKNQEALAQLTSLNLEEKHLTSLPKEICYLTGLQKLNLAENSLQTLPTEFGSLMKLRILNLKYNTLESFPRQIFDLVLLQELHFGNITLDPPIQICALTELRVLRYYPHKDLHPVILQSLKKLEKLNGVAIPRAV